MLQATILLHQAQEISNKDITTDPVFAYLVIEPLVQFEVLSSRGEAGQVNHKRKRSGVQQHGQGLQENMDTWYKCCLSFNVKKLQQLDSYEKTTLLYLLWKHEILI